jgi:uncharacterized protein YcfJ
MKLSFLFLVLIMIFSSYLFSQDTGRIGERPDSFGFSEKEWHRIEKRWRRFQPRVILLTTSGDSVSGQLLYMGDSVVVIYRGYDMMVDIDTVKDVVRIPVDGMDEVFLVSGRPVTQGVLVGIIVGGVTFAVVGITLGQNNPFLTPVATGMLSAMVGAVVGAGAGYGIQKALRKKTFTMRRTSPEYEGHLQKIKKSAVFRDSLFFSSDIYRLREHSRVLRHAFPKKQFRISAGVNIGSNPLQKEMEEMFSTTSLYPLTGSYGCPVEVEYLDLSWRFRDRYVAGGQLFYNVDMYTSLNYQSLDYSMAYYYDIQISGGMAYLDYVYYPVNRFFTKHWEVTAGAGILVGKTSAVFSYYHYSDSTGESSHFQNDVSKVIPGVQLHGTFYYYFFPGLSIYAGMQGNLYRKVRVGSFKVPGEPPYDPVVIPDHRLNFNSIRFRIGASIYF